MTAIQSISNTAVSPVSPHQNTLASLNVIVLFWWENMKAKMLYYYSDKFSISTCSPHSSNNGQFLQNRNRKQGFIQLVRSHTIIHFWKDAKKHLICIKI